MNSGGRRVIELPAVDGTQVLEAVLQLFPVDEYQDPAAWHMLMDDGEPGPAAAEVGRTIDAAEGRAVPYSGIARPEFYRALQRGLLHDPDGRCVPVRVLPARQGRGGRRPGLMSLGVSTATRNPPRCAAAHRDVESASAVARDP
jgi:hypothetical protein